MAALSGRATSLSEFASCFSSKHNIAALRSRLGTKAHLLFLLLQSQFASRSKPNSQGINHEQQHHQRHQDSLSNAKRVELYNLLTKKEIKKFADTDKAISQTTGAAKAAGDEVVLKLLADIGAAVGEVSPATKPVEKPVKAAKAEKSAKTEEAPKKLGIMEKIAKIASKPKPEHREVNGAGRKSNINKIKPTFAGTSKVQAASRRAAVLAFINENKKGIDVAELNEHFKEDCRGFVQKLLEKNHVELVA